MIDVEICLHVTWLTHSYFTRDMADTLLLYTWHGWHTPPYTKHALPRVAESKKPRNPVPNFLCSGWSYLDSWSKWTAMNLGMKSWGWSYEDEVMRMKSWGWSYEVEVMRMKSWGWSYEDEVMRMKSWGWSHEDEVMRMKQGLFEGAPCKWIVYLASSCLMWI